MAGKEVWIGLLHVKMTSESTWEGLKKDVIGSYVQFLCLANSKADIRQQAMEAANDHKVDFVSLSEIEPLNIRFKARKTEHYLVEKAREVLETGNPRFGIWRDYTKE